MHCFKARQPWSFLRCYQIDTIQNLQDNLCCALLLCISFDGHEYTVFQAHSDAGSMLWKVALSHPAVIHFGSNVILFSRVGTR